MQVYEHSLMICINTRYLYLKLETGNKQLTIQQCDCPTDHLIWQQSSKKNTQRMSKQFSCILMLNYEMYKYVLYVGANITEKLTRPSNNLGRADSLSTSKDILKDWLLPAMASQRE